MISHGVRSVYEVLRYRGIQGQWEWVFHRISGLGVVLFLLLHVIDTSTVYFAPSAYNFFLALYKNPFFGIGEIFLAAAVIYHAVNGVRVTVLDLWPHLWERNPQARVLVWIVFALLFIPTGTIMFIRIIQHSFS